MFESFVCPKCGKPFFLSAGSLICEMRHTYDIAKEGYVNLAPTRTDSGDDRNMCRSRRRFLAGGHYQKMADAVIALADLMPNDAAIDLGCGEGWYLRQFAAKYENNRFCGIDLSKTAVKMAAKSEKSMGRNCMDFAVAGIFSLPCPDAYFSAALSIFAPICAAETYRVLKKGGCFIVVGPGEKHLAGLKEVLYENVSDNEMKGFSPDGFSLSDDVSVEYDISLYQPDITDLFAMTPYYWKTSPVAAARLESCESLDTTVSFRIRRYVKK